MNYAIEQMKGVIPALITCFDEWEHVDEKRQRAVVRHLIEQGVHGLYVTGSTGETFLMTNEERKRVVETVIDEAAGRVPVIVHVGAIGTKLSVDLAQHAFRSGADALSSVPPFYWRFRPENIYQYYKRITESTPLPMIVYNIALAGEMSYDLLRRLAEIKGVRGIKYTGQAHFDILRMKSEMGSGFVVFSGADEMAMSGLAHGADGLIGSFYNLMPEVFLGMYEACLAGDLARAKELQRQANEVIFFTLQHEFFSVLKMAFAWMGVDAGFCREPFLKYNKEEELRLKQEFQRLKAEKGIQDVHFLNAL